MKAAVLLATLAVCGCSLAVIDETDSPMTYDPPINSQTFTVRVDSDASVLNVDLIVPGVGTDAMDDIGDDRYEGELPLGACSGVAEFEVEVTTNGIFEDPVARFPEGGRFTHAIAGQPPECENFDDEVAQTFIVDRTEDFPDFIVGNGTCAGVIDGELGCSLRAAVMEANAKPGADLIRVPVGRYVLTRTESGALSESGNEVNDAILDLDITESVTIEGISGDSRDVWDFLIESNDRDENLRDDPDSNAAFVKIDGGGIDRVFQVSGAATVLRLRTLAVINGSADGPGGGILNAGTTVLEQVAIADNEVTRPVATGIGGGGIQNDGILIAEDIALTQNTVGGEVNNPQGGALFNTGTATIRRALIAYNSARFGNALHNAEDAVLGLENATIHDHRWSGDPPVTVVRNEGEMELAFVTVSQNSIEDRTLLSNDAGSEMRLRNVLIIDNTATHCSGTITTLGGNLADAACTLTGTPAAESSDHIDVLLSAFGALDDRGGFTPVYPFIVPSAGSSSFNPVDRAVIPAFPFVDQRGDGFPRRIDGDDAGPATPDPGAYEFEG
ncbi:MAG: hypothetical protein AB7S71_04230 [Dongiaceae bacterium]